VLSGGPSDISGALKSDARSERARILAERGAIGIIALTPPKQVEIVWERQVGISSQPTPLISQCSLTPKRSRFGVFLLLLLLFWVFLGFYYQRFFSFSLLTPQLSTASLTAIAEPSGVSIPQRAAK